MQVIVLVGACSHIAFWYNKMFYYVFWVFVVWLI